MNNKSSNGKYFKTAASFNIYQLVDNIFSIIGIKSNVFRNARLNLFLEYEKASVK